MTTDERLEALIRHRKVSSSWSRFLDAASTLLGVVAIILLIVAFLAWWTVLPTVGFLWLVGAL